MSELEEKLGGILSDPNMMQQIMSMAQMLGKQQEAPKNREQSKPQPEKETAPGIDPGLVRKLVGLLNQSGIDGNQLGLLKALEPYLSRERITRLERAMHAARMAGAASVLLNSGGLRQLSGR